MTAIKVKCSRCGSEILERTAEKNRGMCKPCVMGNKPISSGSTWSKFERGYSQIKQLLFGASLTLAGGFLGALFSYNVFTGKLGNGWFFRYVYSPVFVLLCLLFVVAGISFVVSVFKKSKW